MTDEKPQGKKKIERCPQCGSIDKSMHKGPCMPPSKPHRWHRS